MAYGGLRGKSRGHRIRFTPLAFLCTNQPDNFASRVTRRRVEVLGGLPAGVWEGDGEAKRSSLPRTNPCLFGGGREAAAKARDGDKLLPATIWGSFAAGGFLPPKALDRAEQRRRLANE